MPPKKATTATPTVTASKSKKTELSESDSEVSECEVSEMRKPTKKVPERVVEVKKTPSPTMYMTNTNSSDSDRIKLAQAINNFTIKSEELMQVMRNFDTFKESVVRMDMLMDTKKQEFKSNNELLEEEYNRRAKELQNNYEDRNKILDELYENKNKELSKNYEDKEKILRNKYEDIKNDIKRSLNEDKTRECERLSVELKLKLISEEEHHKKEELIKTYSAKIAEYEKNYAKDCATIRNEEREKYIQIMNNEKSTMELTHRANNAMLTARVEQQTNEIRVLQEQINNLQGEIGRQRELTIKVAEASSKAQITQSIGKN